MNSISFPALGIDFEVSRQFFGTPIYWYGVVIAVGFLLAALYVYANCRRVGVGQEDISDILLAAIPLAVVGARLFYVFGDWDNYKNDLKSVFMIRDGGLAIYGAIIMAVVAVLIMAGIKKINPLNVVDIGALGLLIGQSVGRWGNFFNAEVYGRTTSLPWGMVINGAAPVHPLFLYESLWNILGFLLIRLRLGKRFFRGEMFLMYIGWYGMGRAIFEGMRDNAFVLKIWNLPLSQLTAVLTLFAAILFLALGYGRALKAGIAEGINDMLPELEKAKRGGKMEEPADVVPSETDESGDGEPSDAGAEGETNNPPEDSAGSKEGE